MKLPDSRAFLVRVGDPMASSEEPVVGRIEHIESGLRVRFSSLDEMCVFIRKVLVQEADLEAAETLK